MLGLKSITIEVTEEDKPVDLIKKTIYLESATKKKE